MKCLVTKLKGTVNDDTLLKMGEFRIKFDMSSEVLKEGSYTHSHIEIGLNDDCIVSVIGSGYIGTEDLSVTSKSLNLSNVSNAVYITDDVEELAIENKYAITSLSMVYCRDYEFDISNLYYSKLSTLNLYSDKIRGDVSNLFKEEHIDYSTEDIVRLYTRPDSSVGNSGLYGDITEVVNRLAKNPNGLMYLAFGALNIHGTVKGIVSSDYTFGPFCGDITLDLSGLNFSGKAVEISSYRVENSKAKLTGDISSLKSATAINGIQFIAGEKSEISGDIIDAITGKYRADIFKLGNVKSTKVQDFSKLTSIGDNLLIISNQYSEDDWHIPFTWTKNGYQGQYIIALEGIYMQSHTEDMLVDMASKSLNPKATQIHHKRMAIKALDLEGATENITSAISTLSGKGVTVSITYLGGSKGISLMSADMANKYAIVYKGKDLIVEPTDLRKATVSAAYDCTYKEFDSYEEAQAFVSSNGLVKIESK